MLSQTDPLKTKLSSLSPLLDIFTWHPQNGPKGLEYVCICGGVGC